MRGLDSRDDIRLFDHGIRRELLSDGQAFGTPRARLGRAAGRVAYALLRLLGFEKGALKRRFLRPIDQTAYPDVLAQIQCIVRKAADAG